MNKIPKNLAHCYYVARQSPVDSWYVIDRLKTLEWHLAFIVVSGSVLAEALYDYSGDNHRYYLQRIYELVEIDTLIAFDIPSVNADDTRIDFTLAVPQTINNGNGTQSVREINDSLKGLRHYYR